MKSIVKLDDASCLYRFRVYDRAGQKQKSYVAQITGPDPNYVLRRSFQDAYRSRCKGFDLYVYILDDGIYEQVTKRFDAEGKYLGKERKWLVISGGEMKRYKDEDMNYQYVLYSVFNLEIQRRSVA